LAARRAGLFAPAVGARRNPDHAPEGTITADDLRQTIADLSSDKLEGRGPTTAGDKATRAYLIDRLQRLGYAPGAAGGWEQPFDLVGMKASMPKARTFRKDGKSVSLAWSDQYIAGGGTQSEHGAIDNAAVFVGYGIRRWSGWDDFRAPTWGGCSMSTPIRLDPVACGIASSPGGGAAATERSGSAAGRSSSARCRRRLSVASRPDVVVGPAVQPRRRRTADRCPRLGHRRRGRGGDGRQTPDASSVRVAQGVACRWDRHVLRIHERSDAAHH
jgi:hypothetical protein